MSRAHAAESSNGGGPLVGAAVHSEAAEKDETDGLGLEVAVQGQVADTRQNQLSRSAQVGVRGAALVW